MRVTFFLAVFNGPASWPETCVSPGITHDFVLKVYFKIARLWGDREIECLLYDSHQKGKLWAAAATENRNRTYPNLGCRSSKSQGSPPCPER